MPTKPTARAAQIQAQIAELEARIAVLVDLLPDSEADEAAWFLGDIKAMRAEQGVLCDELTQLELDRALAKASRAAKRAAEGFAKLAMPSDIDRAWLRAKESFDRALGRACVPYERGADIRAELNAARESARTWAREVLEARSDRAARAARGPIRELSVAEQQYARELRLMGI